MRRSIRGTTSSVLATAVGLATLLAFGTPTLAQDGQRPPPKTRQAQVMRPVTYKKILPCQEMLAEDKSNEALKCLQAIDVERLNGYETAVLYQMFGYGYSALENYAKAISFFEKAIATEQLSPGQTLDFQFNVAQMYRALEKLPESIRTFETWLKGAESPTGTQFYAIASTYYQAEKFDKSLELIERALATRPDPEESWLNLAVALYIDKKNYKKAAPLLESMAIRFPKASYWKQLAAVYSELKDDKRSLVAQELAYQQGFLTTDVDLRRLGETYLFLDVPVKGAMLIEKEIAAGRMEKSVRNWQLLADAWLQAREYDKSIKPLEQAAALSGDGKLYIRLAKVHVDGERWDDAIDALNKGVKRGGLESIGETHFLRGIALFNQGKLNSARVEFVKAQKFDDTRKKGAQWVRFIDTRKSAESAE